MKSVFTKYNEYVKYFRIHYPEAIIHEKMNRRISFNVQWDNNTDIYIEYTGYEWEFEYEDCKGDSTFFKTFEELVAFYEMMN